jgi:hypothetical protein
LVPESTKYTSSHEFRATDRDRSTPEISIDNPPPVLPPPEPVTPFPPPPEPLEPPVVPPVMVMFVLLMENNPSDTSSALDALVATRTSTFDTLGLGSVTCSRFRVTRVCTVCHTLVPGSSRAIGWSLTAACHDAPPSTDVSTVTVEPTAGVAWSQ